MNAPDLPLKQQPFLAETHEVVNVAHELGDTNLYLQDVALQEAVRRERAAWAHDDLVAFGQLAGSAEHLALGVLANRFGPELETHDRFGRQIRARAGPVLDHDRLPEPLGEPLRD